MGWISVKERLPERSADVVTANGTKQADFSDSVLIFPNDVGDIGIGSYWFGTKFWEEDCNQCERAPVTHWHPLPGLPSKAINTDCAVEQNEVVCAYPGCTGPYNCKERGLDIV